MERDTSGPGRTQDSVEQIEDGELPNPITDRDQELTEPGEGFEPEMQQDPDDAESEGPPTIGSTESNL